MPAWIEHLGELAVRTGGKSDGSKLGHAPISFRFAYPNPGGIGQQTLIETLTFDDWTNIKGSSTAPSKADIMAAIQTVTQNAAQAVVTNWTRDFSLYEEFANTLLMSTPLTTHEAKWFGQAPVALQDQGINYVSLPVAPALDLSNASNRWLLKLLLAGAAIARWRAITCNRLNTENSFLIKVKPQAKNKLILGANDYTATKLVFDWASFLKAGRDNVHSKLTASPPTATTTIPSDSQPTMNKMITAFCTTLPGCKELIAAGYWKLKQDGSNWDVNATSSCRMANSHGADKLGNASIGPDQKDALIAAVNHARFILWMDWRIGSEVALRQTGSFA
jgi:hypothetical protein